MGRRGPKKTPIKILDRRGSKRAKNRDPGPAATEGRPDPPIYLRPEARREWENVCDQLERMGILGECDGNALARYCQTVIKYWEVEEFLEEHGTAYEQITREGEKVWKEYPQAKQSSRLSEECRKLENLFGLNPSARTDMGQKRITSPRENRGKKKPKSRFFADAAAS